MEKLVLNYIICVDLKSGFDNKPLSCNAEFFMNF